MKRLAVGIGFMAFVTTTTAQKIDRIISEKAVTKIEKKLSSNDMEGRGNFTPALAKAANFIAGEMGKTGLKKFATLPNYLQEFSVISSDVIGAVGKIGNSLVNRKDVLCIGSTPTLHIEAGDHVVRIKKGENIMQQLRPLLRSKKNQLVLIDSSFSATFKNIGRFLGQRLPQDNYVAFVLTPEPNAEKINLDISLNINEQKIANVVGILPGKTKPNEYVIFSGHYDHLGYGKANENGDSLYNGANDDASGVTAMLMLAKYFKKLNSNERTIIFSAFAAEEVGGFGATYFSNQLNPTEVVAMFNIEMIGTESKWGTNSAYITGFEKTNMGEILQKNLAGSRFQFYADPYPTQNLFYRSDNATLARLGVPAHTISTSKMDSEPHYHKASDEIGTLDMKNMAEVIKSIAISAQSIISGKDTPSRVNVSELR